MKHILVALAALAGTQAQALRCLHPDPVRSFQAAMAAPETYVVLRGTVAEAEILIPPAKDAASSYPVPVWFIGHILTVDGFTQSLETPMTVQVNCAGPWCGSMLPEAEVIAFAQQFRRQIIGYRLCSLAVNPDQIGGDAGLFA